MLQRVMRPCSLLGIVKAYSFHIAFAGLTAVYALNSAVAPAMAQDGLNPSQCREAKGATIRTLEEFTGKMSGSLAESLSEFAKSCSLQTKFNRVPGQDDQAWDVFRVRINLIRGGPR